MTLNENEKLTCVQILNKLYNTWAPKTKEVKGKHYHGSKKGDEFKYDLYFDENSLKWLPKKEAFKSYVLNFAIKEFEGVVGW